MIKKFTKAQLVKIRTMFNISTADGWDHLAEDKKGFHYYTLNGIDFFGPFRKKKQAESAWDEARKNV